MNFTVLRVAKLTSLGNVKASGQHTFRERPTPNADPERRHLNESTGANSAAELVDKVKSRLPEKRRKDAVLCLEYVISASPEWFAKVGAGDAGYFRDSIAWLKKKHGAENVVCTDIQRDEKTPHLVAYVVPRHPDGRLSAKEFTGGRTALSKMQTDFWKQVGARHGLDRGIEGSNAKHKTVKEFYAALKQNPTLTPPELPPEPSKMDIVTGKAFKEQREYRVKLTEHAAVVQKAASVTVLGAEQRAEQAKVIRELRGKVVELETVKQENDKLRQALAAKERELTQEKGLSARLQAKLTETKEFLVSLVPYLPPALREKIQQRMKEKELGKATVISR